jgi:hypothetical protein
MYNKGLDFCTNCRKDTNYTLQKRNIVRTINGIKHSFNITVAIYNECGEEMNPHGLIDKNIQEVREQYSTNNTNKV